MWKKADNHSTANSNPPPPKLLNQNSRVLTVFFSLRRTTEVVAGKLEIHEEKYSGKAWTVKVREVLEDLEKVGLYIAISRCC